MIHVLRVLRIHQYAKNFLIFLPFILSNKVFTLATFQQLLLGFFCFSLVASSIYILNDIFDLKYDQKHNIKKYRPIASGKLTPRLGFFISLFLILTSLLLSINFMERGGGINFLLFLISYFLLAIFYSLIAKKIVIFDIIFLVFFYFFRLIIGADLVAINLSFWFIFFSFFLFFSLGTLKRFVEISNKKNNKKYLGRGYYHKADIFFLKILGLNTSLISVLILALYLHANISSNLYASPMWLLATMGLYFIWLIYIWMKASRNEMNEDLVKFIITNKQSIFIIISSVIFFVLSKNE